MKNYILTTCSLLAMTTAIAQKADSSATYFQRGLEEKKAGRWMIAAKNFDKAIAFNPKLTDAYLENGRVSLEMRRISDASLNFEKAYQLAPDNPVAIKELATLYFNNRQFQKAIELAAKCKSCPEADRITAMSYYHLEEYGKAVPGLLKTLARDANDPQATYTLARTYLDMEDYKNALTWYLKAVALDASKPAWFYEVGLIYYNQNDFKNSQKYIEEAGSKGYMKSSDYYENLGYSYLHAGDFDNGLKNLSLVLNKRPADKDIMTDLALAYYNRKQYDNALNWYQKLLEKDTKDAKALYMAGMCFQKKGDNQRGAAMCDEAIKMDPSLESKRTKSMSMGL